jgi:hypothetical protein
MRDYILDNADIILTLQRSGYPHNCSRCERGLHVRHASGLCVWCYNELQERSRQPRLVRSVQKRDPAEPAALAAAPAL